MELYNPITFGMHKGTPVNEIPMDYLIWIFPISKQKKSTQPLYKEILRYFLTKEIRVEDHRNKSQGFHFYFNDYHNPRAGGGERPFMQAFWRLTNSKGEFVYEVGNQEYPTYVIFEDGSWQTPEIYQSMRYKFGGLRMVYERNPEYYFFDGYGKVMRGAYLMRKPWVPHGSLSGDFSENLPIENLEKQDKNHYKTF